MNVSDKDTDSTGFCLCCGKRLKKLQKEKEYTMLYHIKCWRNMINDIKNFETVCYDKYNYKKRICGLTEEEIKEGATIIVEFE